MFKYKVLKGFEVAASKIIPLDSEEENTLFYFYQPDRQFFKLLNNHYQQNLSSLYYDKKKLTISLIKGRTKRDISLYFSSIQGRGRKLNLSIWWILYLFYNVNIQ